MTMLMRSVSTIAAAVIELTFRILQLLISGLLDPAQPAIFQEDRKIKRGIGAAGPSTTVPMTGA